MSTMTAEEFHAVSGDREKRKRTTRQPKARMSAGKFSDLPVNVLLSGRVVGSIIWDNFIMERFIYRTTPPRKGSTPEEREIVKLHEKCKKFNYLSYIYENGEVILGLASDTRHAIINSYDLLKFLLTVSINNGSTGKKDEIAQEIIYHAFKRKLTLEFDELMKAYEDVRNETMDASLAVQIYGYEKDQEQAEQEMEEFF